MTFGDYAFFLFFIFCILKWIWYKKTIWVMIILSTAARRGERPGDLEQGAGLIVKSKIGRGRNEDVWERDLDQGEESFKWNWKHMKSVCVCVCVFSFACTSTGRTDSEAERAWEAGRQRKPHERETETTFVSATIQNHLHLKVWPGFLDHRQVLSAPMFFW